MQSKWGDEVSAIYTNLFRDTYARMQGSASAGEFVVF